MIKLAQTGDVGCRRVIADAGRHIGLAAANMYNLLDPELIVLGGNLAPAGEILLGPLRESMARRAIHAGEVLPPVVVGELDEHVVVVLGAAAAVLRDADRFPLPSQPLDPDETRGGRPVPPRGRPDAKRPGPEALAVLPHASAGRTRFGRGCRREPNHNATGLARGGDTRWSNHECTSLRGSSPPWPRCC